MKDKKPRIRCEYWIGNQKYVRTFGSLKQAERFVEKEGARDPKYNEERVREREE